MQFVEKGLSTPVKAESLSAGGYPVRNCISVTEGIMGQSSMIQWQISVETAHGSRQCTCRHRTGRPLDSCTVHEAARKECYPSAKRLFVKES